MRNNKLFINFKSTNFILIIILVGLIWASCGICLGNQDQVSEPGDQINPNVEIELDTYQAEINTTSQITDPTLQVTGMVILTTQHPYVNINLSVESTDALWNCSVIPNKFNLSNYPTDRSTQEIEVLINAPAGTENGTEVTFTVHGTWSYIPDLPGIPKPQEGEIPPVYLLVTAKNETIDNNNNGGNGNGKKDNGKDDGGFLPGFESLILIASISIIIIFYIRHRKQT